MLLSIFLTQIRFHLPTFGTWKTVRLDPSITNKWLNFPHCSSLPFTVAEKSVVPAVISGSERMIKNGGFPRYVFADSVAISLSYRWTWQHYHFAFDTVEDKAVGTPRSKYAAFIRRSCPIHHGLTPEHCVIPVYKSLWGRYLMPSYKANKRCHFTWKRFDQETVLMFW